MNLMSSSYDYEFNNGQTVSTAAYNGMHPDNLSATMKIEEQASGGSMITVTLNNTIAGKTYYVHAHDAADPKSTPNGTPYNESPNVGLLTKTIQGNGGSVSVTQTTTMSYSSIVNNYEGFFVVHDPLQAISTTNLSTYIILGTFGRTQPHSHYETKMFNYDFNTGQVASAYKYSGMHANTLNATLRLQGLADGTTRVTVMLNNTMNGKMYHTHAHDVADPNTTPNKTPYNETPNGDVCTMMIMGNGSTAYNSQFSSMSVSDISTKYKGFFVIHDPLQAVSTTDPTTYVILGSFAR